MGFWGHQHTRTPAPHLPTPTPPNTCTPAHPHTRAPAHRHTFSFAGNASAPAVDYGRAVLGLDKYCIELPIERWSGQLEFVCFDYTDQARRARAVWD